MAINNKPHVAVFCFGVENTLAMLVLGGGVSELLDIRQLDATTAPRFIGSRIGREGFGFTGDIAEVLVYQGSLSTDEAIGLSARLGAEDDLPFVDPVNDAP